MSKLRAGCRHADLLRRAGNNPPRFPNADKRCAEIYWALPVLQDEAPYDLRFLLEDAAKAGLDVIPLGGDEGTVAPESNADVNAALALQRLQLSGPTNEQSGVARTLHHTHASALCSCVRMSQDPCNVGGGGPLCPARCRLPWCYCTALPCPP